jgi:hypothetical protein
MLPGSPRSSVEQFAGLTDEDLRKASTVRLLRSFAPRVPVPSRVLIEAALAIPHHGKAGNSHIP